jgi:alpha-glucosidase
MSCFPLLPSLRWLLPILLVSVSTAWPAKAPWQKTATGIDFRVGPAQVELAAATPTAFRLSISYHGKPGPNSTTFLDPKSSPPAWEMIKTGNLVGIKSAAGELLFDPATSRWTLLDAGGNTVIPPSGIGELITTRPIPTLVPVLCADSKQHKWVNYMVPDPSISPDTCYIDIPVQLRAKAPSEVYGCGNASGMLLQSKGETHNGNGLAIIPYYWSPSGYAVLAVSRDDEKPASWKPAANGSSLVWHFLGNKADLYLMPADSLHTAAHAYGQLSGMPAVPPRWSFGYLQGKWGWTSRAFIEDALNHFLKHNLPVDAFLFDFEWYTPQNDYELLQGDPAYPDFGWNPATFPQPAEQIDAYRAEGIHFVGIRKPRMGNTVALKLMRDNGWLLRPKIHIDLPSPLMHVGNFANADFRAWYAAQSQPLLQKNIYGWWNDEGDGGFGSYTTYFNWITTESAAFAQAKPGRRLWTLNRSFSPGMQRLGAAAWTGDIQARWDVMAGTPANLLNWSLAGMDYGTCDIGGYSPETEAHLLTRWMEAGVFYPVFHAHSETGRTPHFPWLFGSEAENAIRKAMDLRYRLIPYYYSLAHQAHDTGIPLMRPLVMEFPDDPQVTDMTSQWLMGPGLMAAPILTATGQRTVYLPHDDWFQFGTATKLAGGKTLDVTAKLDEIPAYVRAGTVLPLGPVIQNTDLLPGGPLEIQIYPGHDASFTLVEDDGESTDYLNGAIRRTTFTWEEKAHRLSWKTEGPYKGPHDFHDLKIVLFDPAAKAPSAPVSASMDAAGSAAVPAAPL